MLPVPLPVCCSVAVPRDKGVLVPGEAVGLLLTNDITYHSSVSLYCVACCILGVQMSTCVGMFICCMEMAATNMTQVMPSVHDKNCPSYYASMCIRKWTTCICKNSFTFQMTRFNTLTF